ELAVLSAMAHGERCGDKGVFEALLAALGAVDQDHAELYTDIVLAALPEAIRDYLEALMSASAIRAKYGYQSDFARRYYDAGEAEGEAKGKAEGEAKGKAEGEARAVLAVLDARGIEVPDPVREDITGCTDLDQLDTWIRRAVTADKVQDLFDEHQITDQTGGAEINTAGVSPRMARDPARSPRWRSGYAAANSRRIATASFSGRQRITRPGDVPDPGTRWQHRPRAARHLDPPSSHRQHGPGTTVRPARVQVQRARSATTASRRSTQIHADY